MAATRWMAPLALLLLPALASAQEEPEEPAPVEEPASDAPVPKRREWMADHQSPDGGWSCNGFQSRCEGEFCAGTGTWQSETGSTGLALLAFVGYGETHRTPRYGDVVRKGARRLREIQDGEGCFGIRYPERFLADHAMATLAMAELGGLTQRDEFLQSAHWGTTFLLSQRAADGGWREGDRFLESDAGTTAWAVMALLSFQASGFSVEDQVLRDALAFLDGLTDPETGRVRLHRYDAEWSPRATAAALLVRLLCGAADEDPAVRKGTQALLGATPAWESPIDPEHWYLGTRACHILGGEVWKRWETPMHTSIVKTQRLDKALCSYGSWDPLPGRAEEMGRVATSAFCILCLEVYYRYARVFGSKDPVRRPAVLLLRSPPAPSLRSLNRAAALDPDFPEPRTGFLR